MEREEMIVDGVLCYRNHHQEQFRPYSTFVLTKKIIDREEENKKLSEMVRELQVEIREGTCPR